MSDTASFVDPVFLARFGLARTNVLDYFLHPLNPFRTKANTSNEVLAMQGIGIATLMQQGSVHGHGPITCEAAEHEYSASLAQLKGEQYELLTTVQEQALPQQQPQQQQQQPSSTTTAGGGGGASTEATSEEEAAAAAAAAAAVAAAATSPLFTIRHVYRKNPTSATVLGIYYVLEGVIYKSPSVRSLMKANVGRTLEGLSDACQALCVCARYEPSTGYTWNFFGDMTADDSTLGGGGGRKRKRRRRLLDNRRPGERTAEEEEGIRSSEAIDRILIRIGKKLQRKQQQQQQQQQV